MSKCKTRLDAYKYFRVLHNRNVDLYYALIISDPAKFMPIAYTPTVGEACQVGICRVKLVWPARMDFRDGVSAGI